MILFLVLIGFAESPYKSDTVNMITIGHPIVKDSRLRRSDKSSFFLGLKICNFERSENERNEIKSVALNLQYSSENCPLGDSAGPIEWGGGHAMNAVQESVNR